jgi:coenzyme F420-reducing hydrogenase beta subunit
MITPYADKQSCSGCTACKSICPKQAIVMYPDQDGFLYPTVDFDLCKRCGLCQEVCPIETPISDDKPLATYAAVHRDSTVLEMSSSGGAFSAIAETVLSNNGVVFGCTLDEDMKAVHVAVESVYEIRKLQGSKYVQSDVGLTFLQVKEYLEQGRQVLYTGTPCQIAGLKAFLCRDYANLLTVDLVCHGVASPSFFEGYIEWLGNRLRGRILDFRFRDKSKKGWGCFGSVTYEKGSKILNKVIIPRFNYYYYYYLKAALYRDCCYTCKYACDGRQGDLTIGDYWGIDKAHPEVDVSRGVSVLLVNSEKGMRLIGELEKHLLLIDSSFDKACAANVNLVRASTKTDIRDEVLQVFRENGFKAVAEQYYRANRLDIAIYRLKCAIPAPLKQIVKGILGRSS